MQKMFLGHDSTQESAALGMCAYVVCAITAGPFCYHKKVVVIHPKHMSVDKKPLKPLDLHYLLELQQFVDYLIGYIKRK